MTAAKVDAFSMADIEKKIEEIIEQRITDAKKEIEQLRDENLTLNLELAELQKRVEGIDRNSKRGSVIVKGIKDKGSPPSEEFVRLCDELLFEDVEVIDCIKLPSRSHLMRLASVQQAERILRKRREFKGTLFVNRNLTRNERTKSFNIRNLSKKLQASKTARVRAGDFSLYVNGKVFTWYDGKLFAFNAEDAKMLNDLLKECSIDMTCNVFSKPKNDQKTFYKDKKSKKSADPCYLN